MTLRELPKLTPTCSKRTFEVALVTGKKVKIQANYFVRTDFSIMFLDGHSADINKSFMSGLAFKHVVAEFEVTSVHYVQEVNSKVPASRATTKKSTRRKKSLTD